MIIETGNHIAWWTLHRPGSGIADRSLIALWETRRRIHENRRVYIWSLDEDLKGYGASSG